jgi:hypothetical protein
LGVRVSESGWGFTVSLLIRFSPRRWRAAGTLGAIFSRRYSSCRKRNETRQQQAEDERKEKQQNRKQLQSIFWGLEGKKIDSIIKHVIISSSKTRIYNK